MLTLSVNVEKFYNWWFDHCIKKNTVFFRLVQDGSCQGTETSHPRFSKRGKLDVLALARPVAAGWAGARLMNSWQPRISQIRPQPGLVWVTAHCHGRLVSTHIIETTQPSTKMEENMQKIEHNRTATGKLWYDGASIHCISKQPNNKCFLEFYTSEKLLYCDNLK